MFLRQNLSQSFANQTHVLTKNFGVRPCKVNMLKNTLGNLKTLPLKRIVTFNSFFADNHHLTRLNFPNVLGFNQIKRARFGSQHISRTQSSQTERSKTMRISDSDEFFFR